MNLPCWFPLEQVNMPDQYLQQYCLRSSSFLLPHFLSPLFVSFLFLSLFLSNTSLHFQPSCELLLKLVLTLWPRFDPSIIMANPRPALHTQTTIEADVGVSHYWYLFRGIYLSFFTDIYTYMCWYHIYPNIYDVALTRMISRISKRIMTRDSRDRTCKSHHGPMAPPSPFTHMQRLNFAV